TLLIRIINITDLFHILHWLPKLKNLTMNISTVFSHSHYSLSHIKYLKLNNINGRDEYFRFFDFEDMKFVLKCCSNLKIFSFLSKACEFLNGKTWMNIFVKYAPLLKKFHLFIDACQILTDSEEEFFDINNIQKEFQTDYYKDKQWYIKCDYDGCQFNGNNWEYYIKVYSM
ncbi:unnamed protein product, partial [Didymodactylos carnosus]